MNLNIQSITNKVDRFNLCMNTVKADVVCITEHWLSASLVKKLAMDNYNIASSFCRESSRGGGVMILTANNLQYKRVEEIDRQAEEKILEVTAVFVPVENSLIVSMYRTPNRGNIHNFMEKLNNILLYISKESRFTFTYLAGDFNLDFLVDSKERLELELLLQSYGLQGKMSVPSRIGKTSSTCIDNIFTNKHGTLHTNTINLHLSDHHAQLLSIEVPADGDGCPVKPETVKVRQINEITTHAFRRDLALVDWDCILQNKPAKEAYTEFHDTLLFLFNANFPEKEKKVTTNDKVRNDWHTQKLQDMKNTLDALYTISTVSKNEQDIEAYRVFRKEYAAEVLNAKKKANEEYIARSGNMQKAIWSVINRETGKKKPTTRPSDALSAEDFGDFFEDVGPATIAKIVSTPYSAMDLLHASTIEKNEKSFYLHPVTEEEILHTVQHLKSKPTKDIYGLSTDLIRAVKNEIAGPLTYLINICFSEGYFPMELKIARVIPVHKGGEDDCCNNYRPISLLPVISKVFEGVLKTRLLDFFENSNIFSDSQHGFRGQRSTTTAAMRVMRKIIEAFDKNENLHMSLYDLSKAFDTVNHENLIKKLDYYGVRGLPLDLFRSYLGGREQLVFWRSDLSTSRKMKIGVPQGSILGPILFIIYINDLPSNVPLTHVTLYADDTTILLKNSNRLELEEDARISSTKLEQWFNCNHFLNNNSKLQSVILASKHIRDGSPIQLVKFLGLTIDGRLRWNCHIEKLCRRLSVSLYTIRRMTSISTHQAALMTYYAGFHSAASYGILLWGASPESRDVLIMQKRAVRILCGLKQHESARDAFKNKRILTIPSVFINESLKWIHQHNNDFKRNGNNHEYNTRARDVLRVEHHRLTTTQCSAEHLGIKFFNHLPVTVQRMNAKMFGKVVKRWLVENAFYTPEEFLSVPFKM